jgi:hypothetical protein
VQGQLRKEKLAFQIDTACAHCNLPIHIEIDNELHISAVEDGAEPLIFVPTVDFDRLEDPSIIDAF